MEPNKIQSTQNSLQARCRPGADHREAGIGVIDDDGGGGLCQSRQAQEQGSNEKEEMMERWHWGKYV